MTLIESLHAIHKALAVHFTGSFKLYIWLPHNAYMRLFEEMVSHIPEDRPKPSPGGLIMLSGMISIRPNIASTLKIELVEE